MLRIYNISSKHFYITMSTNGKGDKVRPHKKTIYNKNFDQIKWSKNKKQPTKVHKGRQIYVY